MAHQPEDGGRRRDRRAVRPDLREAALEDRALPAEFAPLTLPPVINGFSDFPNEFPPGFISYFDNLSGGPVSAAFGGTLGEPFLGPGDAPLMINIPSGGRFSGVDIAAINPSGANLESSALPNVSGPSGGGVAGLNIVPIGPY